MKAPSQDFTVLSRGLFLFSGAFAFTGRGSVFRIWVGVYPPTPQRWCCNSPTAAREGAFLSGAVIPCPFLLRSRDNNSTDCRMASSHTYPSYRRVRRTRNTQTTQPIFLSAILSFEPIARALSVQHQPLVHFRYPALYNTAFHYGSVLRSTCPHQSAASSTPPSIFAPQL